MDPRLVSFLARHTESTNMCVAQAVRAIQQDELRLHGVSEAVSSRSLAGIYAVRSDIAAKQGRQETSDEMLRLSKNCEANAENPCSIWMFEGSEASYAIFELLPSQAIGGCFRFSGSVWSEHNGA